MGSHRKSSIPPHKHETPQDRAARHEQVARTVRTRFERAEFIGTRPGFDYTAWLAYHREAENATIFNPNHRDGRRRGAIQGSDRDVDNIAHPGHPSNLGDK